MITEYLELTTQARKQLGYNNSNSKFACFEEFVKDYGKEYKRTKLPDWIIKGEVKECFENCFNNLLKHNNLVYCEGYAVCSSIPVHHAWLLYENKVVDPTWWSIPGSTKAQYYGVPFDRSYVINTAASSGYYGVIDNFVEHFPLITGRHTPDQFLFNHLSYMANQGSIHA